jgi:hypothetical protein
MLFKWQRGELDENTLSDSDNDEDEDNDDGEPIVRYATEEQYRTYVSITLLLS